MHVGTIHRVLLVYRMKFASSAIDQNCLKGGKERFISPFQELTQTVSQQVSYEKFKQFSLQSSVGTQKRIQWCVRGPPCSIFRRCLCLYNF